MPSRRAVIQTVGLSMAAFAGCIGSESPTAETETPSASPKETTHDTRTSTTIPSETRSYSGIYFSEILPNPEGPDSEKLNEEYVLIGVNTDEQRDLSNFTLEYGPKHQYTFPKLVDEVEAGANLVIRSGDGEDYVEESEYPDYQLYVGSDESILDDEGMQLTLRDTRGEVVDSVSYSVEEGDIIVFTAAV